MSNNELFHMIKKRSSTTENGFSTATITHGRKNLKPNVNKYLPV